MHLAKVLAEFITQTRSVPDTTKQMVGNVVLDLMSAAVAGSQTEGAKTGREAAVATWGKGSSTVWFSDLKLSAAGAAFVNSSSASMLDLDDGHRSAAGHPGAAIIPAVFAEADNGAYSGDQMMIAIALGYEVAVRISAARDLNKVDTLVSGRWCAQGVVAAVGWMRGLTSRQMANALSIAATCAPNLDAVAYSKDMGNHVKEGIPWATSTGITAVNLAAANSTGPIDFLDNAEIFNPDTLTSQLGERWFVEGVYFKPYSCCRWAHAAIDAFQSLLHDEHFLISEIDKITIRIFQRALQLNNDVSPKTLEAAQYSIPFCVALVAIHGSSALLPMTEQFLDDPNVLELAAKVELVPDASLSQMFSKSVPAELFVSTGSHQYSCKVTSPKGEPSNPMSRSNLIEKFDVVSTKFMSRTQAMTFKRAMDAFAELKPNELRDVLSIPVL